jgi:hypothetical protein
LAHPSIKTNTNSSTILHPVDLNLFALPRPHRRGHLARGPTPPVGNLDGFVNSPISALRFISLSLRRTESTPRATRFARLELGLFTKPSIRMIFKEPIDVLVNSTISRRGCQKIKRPNSQF